MLQDVLIFDVDGTLTAPRSAMTGDMAAALRPLSRRFPCYAVSGSDFARIGEQAPDSVLHSFAGVFSCSGNVLHAAGREVYALDHEFPPELARFAQAWIARAAFPLRTGRHVEARTGALNLSVIGRNATRREREIYLRHDRATGERHRLAEAIAERFPQYECRLGGQISVDVAPRGWNKGRVAAEVLARHPGARLQFFGDNTGPGGNDEPLAGALAALGPGHRVHAVRDFSHTLAILRSEFAPKRVNRVA